MTVNETAQIMEVISVAYPRFYAGVDRDKTLKLWAALFADDNAHEVAVAVKSFISTDASGFPPSIGAIKQEIVKARMAAMPDATDVWNHLRKAIGNSCYHAGEEFAKLSDVEKWLARSPGQLRAWAMMDAETVDSVVASNIQRAYRSHVEQKQYQMALPGKLAEQRKSIAERRLLNGEVSQ